MSIIKQCNCGITGGSTQSYHSHGCPMSGAGATKPMNTHKELQIGDKVTYYGTGEYVVVGLSTMINNQDGEPEWEITHRVQEVAIAEYSEGTTYQKPCWVTVKSIAPLEPKEEEEILGNEFWDKVNCETVEPTPPSQIEEAGQPTRMEFEQLYHRVQALENQVGTLSWRLDWLKRSN